MSFEIIQKKMKAAILVAQKQRLVIDEISLPRVLEPGQILVKVKYSGICGSQIGEIDGVKGADKYLPHLLGHEGAGTIIQIGPGVSHFEPGDAVILHWKIGVGIQAALPRYLWNGKIVNGGWVTTFNEFAIVSENRCTKMPKMVDMKLGALYGCAITTGFGVIENDAKIKIGESVVVYGSGGVGLNIVQAASLSSAYPIIAVDIYDNKLELARKFGATHLINSNKENVSVLIGKHLSGKELNVFIDNTGRSEVIELGYNLVCSEGRVVLVGVPKSGSRAAIYTLPLHFGKKIIGSHGGDSKPNLDIPRYASFFHANKIEVSNLITNECSLDEINEAIEKIRSGDVGGRFLVHMD